MNQETVQTFFAAVEHTASSPVKEHYSLHRIEKSGLSTMQGCGVIVKYSQLLKGAKENLSCSGIYLGYGLVLTHGSLLVELLKDKKAQSLIENLSTEGYCATSRGQHNIISSLLKDVHGEFQVILASKKNIREEINTRNNHSVSSRRENYLPYQPTIDTETKHLVSDNELKDFTLTSANLERIILQRGVYECLDSLMPASQGWKLLEEDQSCLSPDLEKLITSTFLLLTLSEVRYVNENVGNLVAKAVQDVMSIFVPVVKGDFVYIESSPFGSASPSLFLNSLSHGIICNTSSKGHEVMLTDARCIMGSEGAPVFVMINEQRRPCALVINPFCWRQGEWVGLTLLASQDSVLKTLLQSFTSLSLPKNFTSLGKYTHHTASAKTAFESQPRNGFNTKNFFKGSLKDVSKSVVCVKYGRGWGSGVVISTSPGIILTCAHVTYKGIDKKVTILLSDGSRTQGTVIHQTQPLITSGVDPEPTPSGYSMWDLAVVVTSAPLPHALPLAARLPPEGDGVVVAGYGMFPSRILPTATLSRGVISKVISVPISSLSLPANLDKGGSNGRQTSIAAINNNEALTIDESSRNHTTISLVLDDIPRNRTTTSQQNITLNNNLVTGVEPSSLTKLDRSHFGINAKNISVPVVIQTTCAVYAGGSGGPVLTVHPSLGPQVVGVVVCNMQDSNKTTFPHVNLAIPTPTINNILNNYLQTGDEKVLQYLDLQCTAASHLWGLKHFIRSCL